VFIDFYNIRTEQEFYNKFSSKVIEVTNSKFEEKVKILKKFLSAFKPTFSIDTGHESDFEISLNFSGSPDEIEGILNLPEKIGQDKKIKIVVCLDEFQNIEYFNNPLTFQKTCRSYWQNHKHVSYILYGSKQHMLTSVFQKRNAPFYRFGEVMYLGKIDTIYLVKFVVQRFVSTNKEISEKLAATLVNFVKNHPYYTQQLAYILWNITETKVTSNLLYQAKEMLLDQNTMFYQSDVEDISNSQINFLKAVIANEEKMNSKKVIDKYKLNSSANVTRVKKALIKKEILEIFKNSINFYDPVFELWLKERYFGI
ncbi:MAG: ATP-binding protein, partial [Candidatus Zixiibacteriota bacterium]